MTGSFCLTPRSAAALTAAGLAMSATPPAGIAVDSTTHQPCLTATKTHAEVTFNPLTFVLEASAATGTRILMGDRYGPVYSRRSSR